MAYEDGRNHKISILILVDTQRIDDPLGYPKRLQ